jgi:hydroxymethylglutaryl-CoA reductase
VEEGCADTVAALRALGEAGLLTGEWPVVSNHQQHKLSAEVREVNREKHQQRKANKARRVVFCVCSLLRVPC